MAVKTWEEALAVDDTEYAEVPVGSKGHTFRLASWNAAELLAWLYDQGDTEKQKTNGLVLVAKCLVNDEGQHIGKLDQVMRLREKQPKTVKRLVKAAVVLNGLDDDEKNAPSEAPLIVTGASPIDSPKPPAA